MAIFRPVLAMVAAAMAATINAQVHHYSAIRILEEGNANSPGDLSNTNFTSDLLNEVNNARDAAGVPRLCINSKVNAAARGHAKDMASHDSIENTGTNGSTLMDRLTDQGFNYTAVGETIAAGQTSASSVVSAWLGSPWHRSILLSDLYTFFGGGYAYNGSAGHLHYWVQDFAAGQGGEECDSSDTTEAPDSTASTV